jgi:hypothetical protein
MAVTISSIAQLGEGKTRITVLLTAANDVFKFTANRPSQITVGAEGVSASDLTVQASNNGSDYYALPTAVAFAADGIKSIAVADLGFGFYQLLHEATNEDITATVVITEQR